MAMDRSLVVVGSLAAVLSTGVPASAQFHFERRFDIQSGALLTLVADEGAVEVIGDDSSVGRIAVLAPYGNFRVFTDLTPIAPRINVTRRDSFLEWLLQGLWRRPNNTRVQIRVPRMTDVSIRTSGGPIYATRIAGSVQLNTSGGAIRVNRIDGAVTVRTSGGPIDAWDLGGDLTAHTSGGRIAIGRIRGEARVVTRGGPILVNGITGPLSARTSGGGVTIAAAGDHVDVHSMGGPVSVAFAAGNGAGGTLSSSGGRVVAAIDPSVPLTIDAVSAGGVVNRGIPITTRSAYRHRGLSGDLNGGGAVLRMRATGGRVEIAAIR
jgi:hypothetical protein